MRIVMFELGDNALEFDNEDIEQSLLESQELLDNELLFTNAELLLDLPNLALPARASSALDTLVSSAQSQSLQTPVPLETLRNDTHAKPLPASSKRYLYGLVLEPSSLPSFAASDNKIEALTLADIWQGKSEIFKTGATFPDIIKFLNENPLFKNLIFGRDVKIYIPNAQNIPEICTARLNAIERMDVFNFFYGKQFFSCLQFVLEPAFKQAMIALGKPTIKIIMNKINVGKFASIAAARHKSIHKKIQTTLNTISWDMNQLQMIGEISSKEQTNIFLSFKENGIIKIITHACLMKRLASRQEALETERLWEDNPILWDYLAGIPINKLNQHGESTSEMVQLSVSCVVECLKSILKGRRISLVSGLWNKLSDEIKNYINGQAFVTEVSVTYIDNSQYTYTKTEQLDMEEIVDIFYCALFHGHNTIFNDMWLNSELLSNCFKGLSSNDNDDTEFWNIRALLFIQIFKAAVRKSDQIACELLQYEPLQQALKNCDPSVFAEIQKRVNLSEKVMVKTEFSTFVSKNPNMRSLDIQAFRSLIKRAVTSPVRSKTISEQYVYEIVFESNSTSMDSSDNTVEINKILTLGDISKGKAIIFEKDQKCSYLIDFLAKNSLLNDFFCGNAVKISIPNEQGDLEIRIGRLNPVELIDIFSFFCAKNSVSGIKNSWNNHLKQAIEALGKPAIRQVIKKIYYGRFAHDAAVNQYSIQRQIQIEFETIFLKEKPAEIFIPLQPSGMITHTVLMSQLACPKTATENKMLLKNNPLLMDYLAGRPIQKFNQDGALISGTVQLNAATVVECLKDILKFRCQNMISDLLDNRYSSEIKNYLYGGTNAQNERLSLEDMVDIFYAALLDNQYKFFNTIWGQSERLSNGFKGLNENGQKDGAFWGIRSLLLIDIFKVASSKAATIACEMLQYKPLQQALENCSPSVFIEVKKVIESLRKKTTLQTAFSTFYLKNPNMRSLNTPIFGLSIEQIVNESLNCSKIIETKKRKKTSLQNNSDELAFNNISDTVALNPRPSKQQKIDHTDLHAIIRGSLSLEEKKEQIKILVQNGADVYKQDSNEDSILHAAIGLSKNWHELVIFLMEELRNLIPSEEQPVFHSKMLDCVNIDERDPLLHSLHLNKWDTAIFLANYLQADDVDYYLDNHSFSNYIQSSLGLKKKGELLHTLQTIVDVKERPLVERRRMTQLSNAFGVKRVRDPLTRRFQKIIDDPAIYRNEMIRQLDTFFMQDVFNERPLSIQSQQLIAEAIDYLFDHAQWLSHPYEVLLLTQDDEAEDGYICLTPVLGCENKYTYTFHDSDEGLLSGDIIVEIGNVPKDGNIRDIGTVDNILAAINQDRYFFSNANRLEQEGVCLEQAIRLYGMLPVDNTVLPKALSEQLMTLQQAHHVAMRSTSPCVSRHRFFDQTQKSSTQLTEQKTHQETVGTDKLTTNECSDGIKVGITGHF